MTMAWNPDLVAARAAGRAEFVVRCPACGAEAPPAGPAIGVTVELACQLFATTRAELLGDERRDDLVVARAFVVWVAQTLGPPRSSSLVGRMLGGRDRTTIINLHQRAILLRLRDQPFADACRGIGESYLNQGAADHDCTQSSD